MNNGNGGIAIFWILLSYNDIPQFQADHKEVRSSTAKRWKSLNFQRFSFYSIRHNTAEFGTWAWVLRESHASWGKWLTIAVISEWVACCSVFYCVMQSWRRRLRVHGSTLQPHFSKHKAPELTASLRKHFRRKKSHPFFPRNSKTVYPSITISCEKISLIY